MKLQGMILYPDKDKFLTDGQRTYNEVLLNNVEEKEIFSEVDNWIEPIPYSDQELQEEIERLIAEKYTIRQEALARMDEQSLDYQQFIKFHSACEAQAKINLTEKYKQI